MSVCTTALVDFGSGHVHGAPVYANGRKLIQTLSQLSASPQPDFLYSEEGWYDWEMLDHNRLLDDPAWLLAGQGIRLSPCSAAVRSQGHRRV